MQKGIWRTAIIKPIRTTAAIRSLSAIVAAATILTATAVAIGGAQSSQPAFATPEEAAQALGRVVKAGDLDALGALFGPGGRELLDSSDPAGARRSREVFRVAMAEGWHLVDRDPAGKQLVVGNENWPFPIPLVKHSDGWRFDTAAGKEEIIARRIGHNELAAMRVCRTYVSAQRIYASRGHDGKPPGFYARRITSDPGTENGLYWPTTSKGRRSPLGDLAAQAADDQASHAARKGAPVPFHGYFFRILDGQGASAPGGARSYLANDAMFHGFALVAWPAQYDVTGVMTFIVNGDNVVFEKDLGPETANLVKAIRRYDPDSTWQRASDAAGLDP